MVQNRIIDINSEELGKNKTSFRRYYQYFLCKIGLYLENKGLGVICNKFNRQVKDFINIHTKYKYYRKVLSNMKLIKVTIHEWEYYIEIEIRIIMLREGLKENKK